MSFSYLYIESTGLGGTYHTYWRARYNCPLRSCVYATTSAHCLGVSPKSALKFWKWNNQYREIFLHGPVSFQEASTTCVWNTVYQVPITQNSWPSVLQINGTATSAVHY